MCRQCCHHGAPPLVMEKKGAGFRHGKEILPPIDSRQETVQSKQVIGRVRK